MSTSIISSTEVEAWGHLNQNNWAVCQNAASWALFHRDTSQPRELYFISTPSA